MTCRAVSFLTSALILIACGPPASVPAASSIRGALPVHLTYLGVAGWRIDDGAHVLLVDPYFSRANVEDGSVMLSPDESLIAQYAPARADAILVGHSHYDHLLDVPSIAKRTGARVIGTESTLNVARAAGVSEERLLLAHAGENFEVGPFSVRAIRGLHSLTGQPDAPIPRAIAMPLPADGYAEGGTLQYIVRVEGRTILFIGTANFVDVEVEGLRPDIAVIAVGLREKIPDYACRLMRALGKPSLVFTNHFDAHWKPLGPTQMNIGDDSRAGLTRFADEIHACAPQTKVVVPTHLQPISI